MRELIIACIENLPDLKKVMDFFQKNPRLNAITFEGESYIDDHDLIKQIDTITINHLVYRDPIEWDDGIYPKNRPMWLTEETLDEAYDLGLDIFTTIARSEEIEDLSITFTRGDIEKYTPFANVLINLKTILDNEDSNR